MFQFNIKLFLNLACLMINCEKINIKYSFFIFTKLVGSESNNKLKITLSINKYLERYTEKTI